MLLLQKRAVRQPKGKQMIECRKKHPGWNS